MKEVKYYIYKHIRPDTNTIFYIGVGKEGTDRINHKRRNGIWKNIVAKNNKAFVKDYLFRDLSIEEADQIETYLIAFYGKIKDRTGILANILDGGHKNKDYHKMSPEEKEALRLKMVGNTYSKGNKFSVGRKQTESAKKRIGQANKGNPSNTGKIWINDGIKRTVIFPNQEIPEGWKLGYKLTNN